MVVLVEEGEARPAKAFDQGLVCFGDQKRTRVQVYGVEVPLCCVVPLSSLEHNLLDIDIPPIGALNATMCRYKSERNLLIFTQPSALQCDNSWFKLF